MRILICTDGSEQAEKALRLGSAIASACEAEATLLGVVEHPGESKGITESLARGQAALLAKKVKVEMITRTGKPLEEIIQRTREASYDLVVVGAVRKQSRGAFWLSSKTYKIMKELTPPVLSVTGDCSLVKKVLICSGGKPYIDTAVKLAGEICKCMGASAVLLHVLPELPAIYAHLPGMDETADWLLNSHSELGRNLRHTKELVESFGNKVEFRVRHGPVLLEILRELREGGYDLVVTGSALSRTLRTYVLGDVTREIVNRADCAVLVARSRTDIVSDLFRLLGRFLPGARREPARKDG